MKYIMIVILVVLALLTLTEKETNSVKLIKNNTILALGDSLTYGFGANPSESYPALLSEMTGLRVINAGINGETSKEGLVRLPKLLEDPSIKLMILFFGGNDIMQRRSREELKQNLKTMIQLAKQKHIDVLLISVPNIGLFGLSPLSLYKEVAEEENIPLLSGMLADILSQPSLKNDQIHPNGSGYKKMAERIYETLKEHGWINN
jgi:lysophospholipase L1-like esterase